MLDIIKCKHRHYNSSVLTSQTSAATQNPTMHRKSDITIERCHPLNIQLSTALFPLWKILVWPPFFSDSFVNMTGLNTKVKLPKIAEKHWINVYNLGQLSFAKQRPKASFRNYGFSLSGSRCERWKLVYTVLVAGSVAHTCDRLITRQFQNLQLNWWLVYWAQSIFCALWSKYKSKRPEPLPGCLGCFDLYALCSHNLKPYRIISIGKQHCASHNSNLCYFYSIPDGYHRWPRPSVRSPGVRCRQEPVAGRQDRRRSVRGAEPLRTLLPQQGQVPGVPAQALQREPSPRTLPLPRSQPCVLQVRPWWVARPLGMFVFFPAAVYMMNTHILPLLFEQRWN